MDGQHDDAGDSAQPDSIIATPSLASPHEVDKSSSESASGTWTTKKEDEQSPSALLRTAADRTLVFLSNATNETLGACLVGLGATTYLVLGRVGLVLIGAVGGVVLHATWINTEGSGADGDAKLKETARRREVGVDVARRLLDWGSREQRNPAEKEDLAIVEDASNAGAFSHCRPETAGALTSLTDAIVRDYVKWWYSPIIPADVVFPSTCRQTLTNFITSFSMKLARKRPADTFVEFTTNSSSIIIVVFSELAAALTASPTVSASDAISAYLRLKPQSSLANIVDREHQQRKLQVIADEILESNLDTAVYRCAPARVFLRQILANSVLDMSIERCAQAEWINEWIVYLLEEGEPELMNVIDAGVENSGAQQALKAKVLDNQHNDPNAATPSSEVESSEQPRSPKGHKKSTSRAEEAMDEAMQEAQRLTQMIIEEEEKKQKGQQSAIANQSDSSETTSYGVATPMSSQSEVTGDESLSQPTASAEKESLDPIPSVNSDSAPFTNFDQLAPSTQSTSLVDGMVSLAPREPEALTLFKANISLFDDGNSSDKRPMKVKQNIEYLVQIEPHSTAFPGWMIARTYVDFETLHEVLRRISNITGVDFTKAHASLPHWKGLTKMQLKDELERYLQDALRYDQLAESEGMKRFLEKDQGLAKSSASKAAFWPNPTKVGKGMFDVLTKAPNQVAGGGKAFIGGVSSAFGAVGTGATAKKGSTGLNGSSRSTSEIGRDALSVNGSRTSLDQNGSRWGTSSQLLQDESRPSQELGRSPSFQKDRDAEARSSRSSLVLDRSVSSKPADGNTATSRPSEVHLPPPPEAISDDYAAPGKTSSISRPPMSDRVSHMSVDGTDFYDVPTPPTPRSPMAKSPQTEDPPAMPTKVSAQEDQAQKRKSRLTQPLSEQEAQVTIELLFAVINELYTLSSAWNIRRTLLTAAKGFLLRPGNPQLESIRAMIQESMLEANTSDAGIAGHILKLRENSVPTEEELVKWPKPRDEKEKEKLRIKARKLLVERGMPQALTSVMGAAASGEALGKVFDCLQIENIARGVMFGLMLQAVRAMTQ
ncbi:MAG: hypothetical protein M1828_003035 [Chrysothrix sp. TS-e1954]|nr:MAG: hypothetical protein M1828_003035 [Chrysothrix sp. TS-e1954]